MRITIDDRWIEVRRWAEGKSLIMTRDEGIKDAIDNIREKCPGAVELLTDPDIEEVPEDREGLMMIIVDNAETAIIFELEEEKVGLAIWQGTDEAE